MPLMPSLRRALARLLGGSQAGTPALPAPPASPRPRVSVSTEPGTLIPVGNHVVFATSPREAERAIVLLMDGADEPLRKACRQALQEVRGTLEGVAA